MMNRQNYATSFCLKSVTSEQKIIFNWYNQILNWQTEGFYKIITLERSILISKQSEKNKTFHKHNHNR